MFENIYTLLSAFKHSVLKSAKVALHIFVKRILTGWIFENCVGQQSNTVSIPIISRRVHKVNNSHHLQ